MFTKEVRLRMTKAKLRVYGRSVLNIQTHTFTLNSLKQEHT
jgi:hypothetical protein